MGANEPIQLPHPSWQMVIVLPCRMLARRYTAATTHNHSLTISRHDGFPLLSRLVLRTIGPPGMALGWRNVFVL